MKRITLWLDVSIFKKLKMLALTEGFTIGEMVGVLIENYLKLQEDEKNGHISANKE